MTAIEWLGPQDAPVLVLAHGAGASMQSPWLVRMSELLAERGVRTARFEFGYMAARREGRRPPVPRADTLLGEYAAVVDAVLESAAAPVAIGGKSMGGRVASMTADALRADGRVSRLVCLGYPFHPPGRPDRLRTDHLARIETPTLICQGTRDPFGTRDEVVGYPLDPRIRLLWLEDGEHDLKPRTKVSGFTHAEHLATTADAVARFLTEKPTPVG